MAYWLPDVENEKATAVGLAVCREEGERRKRPAGRVNSFIHKNHAA